MTHHPIATTGLHPVLAAGLLMAAPAFATTIFDNGAVNDVTTALDDVVVTNGSTVNFLPGGSATAPPVASPLGLPGVTLEANSILTVAGGSITGGKITGSGFSGDGIVGFSATGRIVNISSGSVTGGTNANSGSGTPGDAINLVGVNLTVSGGTISGGVSTVGGLGGEALQLTQSTLDITGGNFTSGQTTLLNLFEVNGTISGGTFNTGDQGQTISLGASSLSSTIDITGGQFESGSFWAVGNMSTINVFGTNLAINSDILTGKLADGSDLNVRLNLFGGGAVNLIPEPGSLTLLSLGGLLLTRRRR